MKEIQTALDVVSSCCAGNSHAIEGIEVLQKAIDELRELRTKFRDRIILGQRLAKKKGRFPGGERFGFQRNNHKLEKVKSESELLEKIQTMRAGGQSYQEIADFLNDNFVPSKKFKKWHGSTIWYILNKNYVTK